MNKIINYEAKAFDLRIKERMDAGHIPDLRRIKSCPYFYNNVWREPLYVSISIGTRFAFMLKHVDALRLQTPRVLEIGCGVGFISLELARNGCNVIGIDVSEKSIEIAKKMATENPYKKGFGSVEYHVAEIFNFLENCKNTFDAVVFYGILHHFSFFELKRLCPLIKKVTKKNGIVVGYEPCYDRFNEINALLLLTLKILLKSSANYFEDLSIPKNEYELMEGIRKNLLSGKQIKENLTKTQSIKDFSSGYTDIITSLTLDFETIEYKNDHGLFELIAGGLRGKKKDLERLAKFIDVLDRKLIEIGAIEPLSFCFAGRRR